MTSKLLVHLTILFLVVSFSCCKASSQDWVDYGDEEDADETNAASWKRELAEVSPGSGAAAGYGMAGGYGSNSGRTSPYGVSPMGPGILSPPPVGVLSPPPPPQAAVASYSTSATVPGVTSTATLSSYANVAAFNTAERLRFTTTLQNNIFSLLKTLANVTIDSVTPGSINVANTVAFTGSDSTQAASSAAALVTALNSGDTSVFGTSFGTIQVSGVSAANTSNPTASGKSGASSTQWTLLPIVVAVVVIAVATMTLVSTSS